MIKHRFKGTCAVIGALRATTHIARGSERVVVMKKITSTAFGGGGAPAVKHARAVCAHSPPCNTTHARLCNTSRVGYVQQHI